jgi:hypothetical protein
MASKCDDLEQMVLDHVAQAARGLIERPTAADAEVLGECDLHAGHIVAVPERLQKRVGESEVEDVHDRLLRQEVIDAEDRIFREHLMRDAIQRPRRGEVAPKGLLDNDACVFGQPGGAKPFDHRSEKCWRDGKVVRRTPRALPQRPLDRREGVRVFVVSPDILKE